MGDGEAAFGAAATDYDRSFTDSWSGRVMRAQVHSHLEEAFRDCDTILDLGCGTGEDAVWLARRGVQVTAVDASAEMLTVAAGKAAAVGVEDRVDFIQADLGHLRTAFRRGGDGGEFDGALANFGVLNCVEDRRALAAALAASLRPGGILVVVVMGPFCMSEVAWYLLHGNVRAATRRWRQGEPARVGPGATVPVWYPGPRRLQNEFASWFALRRRAGIGAILPSVAPSAWPGRWPSAAAVIEGAERRVGAAPWSAWFADHHLADLERR
jgi:ubiquinone/menaquinone biosynthesis C-methylase UbiE